MIDMDGGNDNLFRQGWYQLKGTVIYQFLKSIKIMKMFKIVSEIKEIYDTFSYIENTLMLLFSHRRIHSCQNSKSWTLKDL